MHNRRTRIRKPKKNPFINSAEDPVISSTNPDLTCNDFLDKIITRINKFKFRRNIFMYNSYGVTSLLKKQFF